MRERRALRSEERNKLAIHLPLLGWSNPVQDIYSADEGDIIRNLRKGSLQTCGRR